MNEMNIYSLKELGELRKHFHATFYQAFKDLPQTLLRRIWNVDDVNQEISLKTNDDDVFVIPWIVDGSVCAYFVYKETKSDSFSQLHYFGFQNHINFNHAIEVLTMFRTDVPLSPEQNLRRDFLTTTCRNLFIQRGYRFLHATCTEKILPVYLRWDVRVVEQTEIAGFKRFHIMTDI
jgi:hypothetical protein